MVFWNSIPSSVSKEDVTHGGFAAMQLDGEARSCRRCHGDALARRLLSQEAAHVSLPSPLPLGLRSSLSPSPQNVDEQKQHTFHTARAGGAPSAVPLGGRAQPRSTSSLPSADVVRHAQAKPCSHSLIIKKNSWQQLSVTQLQKNHLGGKRKKKKKKLMA